MAPRALSRYARTPSRKLLTRKSANRTFSKAKRQWVTAYNTSCDQLVTVPLSTCPNGGVIGLLNNASLHTDFEDAVRIARIEGKIWFWPTPAAGTDCQDILNQWANNLVYFRAGLRKSTVNAVSGAADAINPLDAGVVGFGRGAYQDGKWMRLWDHVWAPSGWVSNENAPLTCCPVVTSPGSINPLVAGTGTVTIPAIVTECITCNIEEQPSICQYGANTSQPWCLNISYRRPIRMTELDELALWFGWERLGQGIGRLAQPAMRHFGGVRLLLEK